MTAILNEHFTRCSINIEGVCSHYKICGGIRPLKDTTISYRNKQFAADAGLKAIRIHDFRHSHASPIANARINIQEISRRLGHAKIEITWNINAHLYPQEERVTAVLDQVA